MPFTIPLRTSAAAASTSTDQASSGSGSGSGGGDYQLFEIPPDLLAHFTSAGASSASVPTQLTIKGQPNDSAVLTTATSTYALRSVSQSNSLLVCSLAPSASSPQDATSGKTMELQLQTTISDTLECQLSVPHLGRITSLLRPTRYRGRSDAQPSTGARLYRRHEIFDLVQASDAEIVRGLDEQRVVELDGVMRQLDDDFTLDLLKAVLAQVEVNAYLLEQVPLHELVDGLDKEFDIEPSVTRQACSRLFGKVREGQGRGPEAKEEDEVVELDAMAITRFIGIQQLKTARMPIPLSTFFHSWQAASGSTLSPHVSLPLLRGEYILHPAAQPYTSTTSTTSAPAFSIQRFSIADLPTAPAARFQDLFNTRPSWTAEDLDPFIEDLVQGEGLQQQRKKKDALLLKFCRASKVKIVDWSGELARFFGHVDEDDEARQGGVGDEAMAEADRRRVKSRTRKDTKLKDVTLYTARVKF
ncbi:uncharacterized protein PFL1_02756 [Pseudozyma flocculosa PF-1]|uniref:Sister chromatid cohesion protein DCC1 n=2 Tax=Pseudozyma flocculosa TaxID=84751 RepID=A0A5C3F495_9BASI|nr:uncharacterized protein PFL1_02756 [Pseudozyma flocculosa PF-1]EPQ29537.1 hypothetical protein PFL1_02756 [Pseudozyma flocculosa PF-1]SPO38081.1 uncharacterized protein PSFLO_03558 [Pseudozyma flocculosa]